MIGNTADVFELGSPILEIEGEPNSQINISMDQYLMPTSSKISFIFSIISSPINNK